MKTRLVPVYFDPGRDSGFDDQVNTLRNLLAEEAEILAPVALGDPIPDAEAVVFPQIRGDFNSANTDGVGNGPAGDRTTVPEGKSLTGNDCSIVHRAGLELDDATGTRPPIKKLLFAVQLGFDGTPRFLGKYDSRHVCGLDVETSSKTAAHGHTDDVDVTQRYAEYAGNTGTNSEVALGARPNGQFAGRLRMSDRHMRFHVYLMNARDGICTFDDDIGLGETLFHVTRGFMGLTGDIVVNLIVELCQLGIQFFNLGAVILTRLFG